MNTINSWSPSKKILLAAVWIFATVGRVAYVSLDVPGEAMSMFIITAVVLAMIATIFQACNHMAGASKVAEPVAAR